MRITFTIGSLGGGGAERVLVLLSKAFLRRGHAVSVVTLLGEENDFYELPSQVQRMSLGISGPFSSDVADFCFAEIHFVNKTRCGDLFYLPDEYPDIDGDVGQER